MMKTRPLFGLAILQLGSCLAFSGVAVAGGPLILQGPTGNTPVSYQNPSITLHVENGNLGTISNADADIIMRQAFDLWNTVNTSTIKLIFNDSDPRIAVDINGSNFGDFIPKFNGDNSNSNDGLNPVVYDSNGEIIDQFFGVGASDNTIGFAASSYNINGSFLNEGYAVINGKQLSQPLTDTERRLLIAHEIGHFFGLDHSQTNIDNRESVSQSSPFFICTTTAAENYPVMYPFVCRDIKSLHADDISAVSTLYPSTDINNNLGILQGHFVDASGAAILGANIWAENNTTGAIISIVSDYLKQGTGFYKLHLPAGNYTLHANSINPLFFDGSSIGPYAETTTDRSFTAPHPIADVTYQNTASGNAISITIDTCESRTIDFSVSGDNVVLDNNSNTVTAVECFTALPASSNSSGSSGISWITLLLLLSSSLLARYPDLLKRLRSRIVSTTKNILV